MKKKWKNEKKYSSSHNPKKNIHHSELKRSNVKNWIICVRQSRRLKRLTIAEEKSFSMKIRRKKKESHEKKVKSQRRNGNFFLSFFFTPWMRTSEKGSERWKSSRKMQSGMNCDVNQEKEEKRGWKKKLNVTFSSSSSGLEGASDGWKKPPKKLNEQRKKRRWGGGFFRVLCVWKALVGQEEANGYIVYIRQSTSDGKETRMRHFVWHRNFCGLCFGFTPGKRHFGQENWLKNMVHLSK